MLGPRIVELRSSTPRQVNSSAQAGYEVFHAAPLAGLQGHPPGWGDLASANPGKRVFVRRERAAIARLLGDRVAGRVVDVSGGVGNYSSYLAQWAQLVVHCELHVPSFAQACRNHGHLPNMLFARSEYLALPLAEASVDGAICTDTLIRGPQHDRALLEEIRRILKPGGRAVVDFQHHRFKRIQKRSPLAICYELEEFTNMAEQSGLAVRQVQGIGYVPTRAVPWEGAYDFMDLLFRLAVSPSRYLLAMDNPAELDA